MKTVLHTADSRGIVNHGWLQAKHTFSFSSYFNKERMNFGALRVINDDTVAEGMGFGMHPHRDMEIITIPLEGELLHKDNIGHEGVISSGEIQVMSAGTGIYHSEVNASHHDKVKLLQIWVIPNREGVEPRYAQQRISNSAKKDDFQQIVSPNPDDEGLWIYQNAWFHWADFSKGVKKDYILRDRANGVYIFVVEGGVRVNDISLGKRDGLGIYDLESFSLEALEDSKVLLMEVPMEV